MWRSSQRCCIPVVHILGAWGAFQTRARLYALRLLNSCWIAAEAQDTEIKAAHLLSCMWHWDTYTLIIQISKSSGVEANWRGVFCSLSLRSGFSSVHLSSLHMLIFRPRSADEANFSNLQFAQLFSIIPPLQLLSFPSVQFWTKITCWLTAKAN